MRVIDDAVGLLIVKSCSVQLGANHNRPDKKVGLQSQRVLDQMKEGLVNLRRAGLLVLYAALYSREVGVPFSVFDFGIRSGFQHFLQPPQSSSSHFEYIEALF